MENLIICLMWSGLVFVNVATISMIVLTALAVRDR